MFVFICFVFGILSQVQAAGVFNMQRYLQDHTFNGLIASTGFNGDTSARSLQECGIKCLSQSGCASFFYVHYNYHCQTHDTVLQHTTGLLNAPQAVYFVSESQAPVPFSCPPDDTIFRSVLLSDGTSVTYRVFNTSTTYALAQDECISNGGRLLQVLTEARNIFTTNLLMCTGYDVGDYWLDGSNANATDFYDLNGWKTSDGVILPTQFWDPSQPNSPEVDNCVAMYQAFSYAWADRRCSYSNNFICEIP